MNNPNYNRKLKRFMAYMIDMIIIAILVVGVSRIDALHPKHEEYAAVVEELADLMESTTNGTVLTEAQTAELRDLVLAGSKYQASYLISEVIIIILYFSLFPTFNKGMTVGKRAMRLQVVSDKDDNSKAKLWQHLVKAALCPIALSSYLLRNTITYIFLLGGLLVFGANTYLSVVNWASMAITVLCYLDVFRMMLKEDGRGLSDNLAKVKVIDYVRD